MINRSTRSVRTTLPATARLTISMSHFVMTVTNPSIASRISFSPEYVGNEIREKRRVVGEMHHDLIDVEAREGCQLRPHHFFFRRHRHSQRARPFSNVKV